MIRIIIQYIPMTHIALASSSARQTVLHSLFGDHHGWLLSRLRARLGCTHDAADMAAEVFAQVVALSEPQSIREPRALLTTIAKRLMYDGWRRRDLERAYLEALALQPQADYLLHIAPSWLDELQFYQFVGAFDMLSADNPRYP